METLFFKSRLSYPLMKEEKAIFEEILQQMQQDKTYILDPIDLFCINNNFEKNIINVKTAKIFRKYLNHIKYNDSHITQLIDALIFYSNTECERAIQIGKMKRRLEALNQIENKENVYFEEAPDNHFFNKVIESNFYKYIFEDKDIFIYRERTENKQATNKIYMIKATIENNNFIFKEATKKDIELLNQRKNKKYEEA